LINKHARVVAVGPTYSGTEAADGLVEITRRRTVKDVDSAVVCYRYYTDMTGFVDRDPTPSGNQGEIGLAV
jgi:hypothetical protein